MARQMARMAAKAKQTREKQQAQEQQKWAQAQKHEEEESAKESEAERTADEHELHKLREEAAKSDQPKCRKRTIDEAEDEEVGTSGVSKAVAGIFTPPQAEDIRKKKRVLVAKDLAAISVQAQSPIRKPSVLPCPSVRVRRNRKAARRWKSIIYFDLAVAGLFVGTKKRMSTLPAPTGSKKITKTHR
jgi:flagellar biosynthesis GTPase FlhF